MSLHIVKTVYPKPSPSPYPLISKSIERAQVQVRGTTGLHQYHQGKNHLFFNYDFSAGVKCFQHPMERYHCSSATIRPGDRVHIFLSRENPSLYNRCLSDFIWRAIGISKVKIYIHIPKSRYALKDYVESMIVGIPNVRLIFEKPSQVWYFWKYERYSRRVFHVVKWNHDFITIGQGETYKNDDVTLRVTSDTL